jgi:WD40 repeat protein
VGHKDRVSSVSFNPTGDTLVSASYDNNLILWDIGRKKQIGAPLFRHTDAVLSAAFSPDGKAIASSGFDRTIVLWDVKSQQPIGDPLRGRGSSMNNLAFSPDGKKLASASADSTVILWDLDPNSWIQLSCQRAGRSFTQTEWSQYFPGVEYHATCP